MSSAPRILVNDERTILVTLWMEGNVIRSGQIATREHSWHTWGPPVRLLEEIAGAARERGRDRDE